MGKSSSHFIVVFSYLLIAGAFIAFKNLAGHDHPLSINMLRFLMAGLSMLPIVLFSKPLRSTIKPALLPGLIIGFFYGCYYVLVTQGLSKSTAVNASSISSLSPIVTALFSIFIFKTRLTKARIIAYLIATVGTAIVVFNGEIDRMLGLRLTPGDPLLFLAVLLLAGYYITMQRFGSKTPALTLAFTTVLACIFWLGLSLVILGVPLRFHVLSENKLLYSLLYIAICTTSVTTYLQQEASRYLSADQVSAYRYLLPIMTAFIDVAITGDHLSLGAWVGVTVSIAACVVLLLKAPKHNLAPA